jgi:hypothetical protein
LVFLIPTDSGASLLLQLLVMLQRSGGRGLHLGPLKANGDHPKVKPPKTMQLPNPETIDHIATTIKAITKLIAGIQNTRRIFRSHKRLGRRK